MNHPFNGPRYLMRWDPSRDQRLGRDILTTTHRLGELQLFSDGGLAQILDAYPEESIQVSTMGDNPAYPNQFRLGQLGNHTGMELIEMVRRGRLCLKMKHVIRHHAELADIVNRLCGEMMECQPGLRTLCHDGDLEISSPTAMTYFRCDRKPKVFWQLRGSRTVFVYPANEPFLQTHRLEECTLGLDHRPWYFEPAFDADARRCWQLEGDVLALPQFTPYRIVNDPLQSKDWEETVRLPLPASGSSSALRKSGRVPVSNARLSVTLSTRYETRRSQRRDDMHRANAILNRFSPWRRFDSIDNTGLGLAAKYFVLWLMKTSNRQAATGDRASFRIDPQAPQCVGSLEQRTAESATKVPLFPTIHFPVTPASVVSEY